jgi:hypothetical protein
MGAEHRNGFAVGRIDQKARMDLGIDTKARSTSMCENAFRTLAALIPAQMISFFTATALAVSDLSE